LFVYDEQTSIKGIERHLRRRSLAYEPLAKCRDDRIARRAPGTDYKVRES
jgi:hypothetical protein